MSSKHYSVFTKLYQCTLFDLLSLSLSLSLSAYFLHVLSDCTLPVYSQLLASAINQPPVSCYIVQIGFFSDSFRLFSAIFSCFRSPEVSSLGSCSAMLVFYVVTCYTPRRALITNKSHHVMITSVRITTGGCSVTRPPSHGGELGRIRN